MPHRDFDELVAAFNARGVRFLVVGAHAVAFHARPRATKDVDLFIDPTRANARRVLAALHDFFGGHPPGFTEADLTNPEVELQIGVAPVRVDLLTRIDGVPSFSSAWRRSVEGAFGEERTRYLGLDDLIAAKEAAGRPQDLADLVTLRRAAARGRRR